MKFFTDWIRTWMFNPILIETYPIQGENLQSLKGILIQCKLGCGMIICLTYNHSMRPSKGMPHSFCNPTPDLKRPMTTP